MARPHSHQLLSIAITLTFTLTSLTAGNTPASPIPTPTRWPEQFHALLLMNNTKKPNLQVIDLWYDWPNGRNLNLIQNQLGKLLHDVEWNNGTSYYYTLGIGDDGGRECKILHFDVGILRPDWLDGANYLGRSYVDGFLCDGWEKVDFIWYYEDVITKRPVHWLFYTGMAAHVMTFEVGAVLEDSKWQAPVHCFDKQAELQYAVPSLQAGLLRPSAASEGLLMW